LRNAIILLYAAVEERQLQLARMHIWSKRRKEPVSERLFISNDGCPEKQACPGKMIDYVFVSAFPTPVFSNKCYFSKIKILALKCTKCLLKCLLKKIKFKLVCTLYSVFHVNTKLKYR